MAKFKMTGKLTLANDGSLIYVPMSEREQYFADKFGLQKPQPLTFKKHPNETDKAAAERISLATQEEQRKGGDSIWTPKQEDLVRIPFRALSATVVAAGTWRTTDFTDTQVLKRGMNKLKGKSAFTEHWQYSDNCIGVVEQTAWAESTLQNGRMVPAGIDVVYLINAKLNEKLVSNLLMDPPAIYSNSVTVEFEWEPSHDNFTDADDFMRKIGQVHADGRMVARKVTDIIDFHESSILWMGADPFAKMKDKEGNLINPEYGAAFDQVQAYTKEAYEKNGQYYASYSYKKENIVLTSTKIQKDNTMNIQELLLSLTRNILNLAADVEITEAHVNQLKALKFINADEHTKMTDALTKLPGLQQEVATLKGKNPDSLIQENTSLKTEKQNLEKQVSDLKPLADIGTAHLAAKRSEVERLYRVSLGEGKQADQTMLDQFTNADNKTLDTFLALFMKGAGESFEATCKTCGKTEVSFRSSFTTDDPNNPANKGKKANDQHLAFQVRD